MKSNNKSEDVITGREQAEIDEANASGRVPVVFVHGLWLHATSWSAWADLFRSAGFASLTPGWPGDPDSVDEARSHPDTMAGVGIADVTHHYANIVRRLEIAPLLVGHSFGGLIVEKLLGMGLGYAGVAIDAAPFQGVLPLPVSALRSALPALGHPSTRKGTVALTEKQFRYAFANAVSDDEAHALYERYAIPAPGRPLFQAAVANFDPKSEASVDVDNAQRGPLLLIAGELDHTVPPVVTKASYKRHRRSPAPLEMKLFRGRGHSLTIDNGWRELADYAIAFAQRSSLPRATTDA